MIERSVHVSIINDSRVEGCEGACGIDWSDPDELELAVKRVSEKFGGGVDVSFFDLAVSGVAPEMLKWSDEVNRKELPYPLLVLNDRLRIAGNFDVRRMLDVIEVETEMEL